jgi:thiol-disulfide isomerase/thioredoxin
MVVPRANGEQIYVDRNGNRDLSDDGSPAFFSQDSNGFVITCCQADNQIDTIRILVTRRPNLPDTNVSKLLDDNGNLRKGYLKWWGKMLRDTSISGKRGKFYFTDQLSMRRGTIVLGTGTYDIGIVLNGFTAYNDTRNSLVIDQNGDHVLPQFPQEHDNEVYKMNDVFEIGGKNYRVVDSDRQGAWLEVEQTVAPPTSHSLEQMNMNIDKAGELREVDHRVWGLTLRTIHGEEVKLRDHKGRYLLINIWGEWCGPCLAEMPALQHAGARYPPTEFQIVGFIKMLNRDLALKVIEERKISWPQVILTNELEDLLQPRGFPTNMLILPDARTMKVTNVVNEEFFKQNIR